MLVLSIVKYVIVHTCTVKFWPFFYHFWPYLGVKKGRIKKNSINVLVFLRPNVRYAKCPCSSDPEYASMNYDLK